VLAQQGAIRGTRRVEGGDLARHSGMHVAEGRGWRNRRAERAGFTGRGGMARHSTHTARRQQELQGVGGSRNGRCHGVQQHLRRMKAIRAGRAEGGGNGRCG
jgi:hypothetical protein